MRHRLTFMLCLTLGLATPALSHAQNGDEPADQSEGAQDDKADFKSLTADASAAYEAGDFERAVNLFEQAYAVRKVSNILYNIARIHEEAGNIDEAIEYYDKFVVAPKIEQTARKDALERLKTLREVKAMRDGETETASANETTETTETTEPVKIETTETADSEPPAARTVGWVMLGVGGASLIGSGVFGLLTQQQFDNFDSATTLEDRRDAARAGQTTGLVADSLLVAGAASAIVGGILVLSSSGDGDTAPKTASRMKFAPVLGAKTVGVGMTLDFD